MLVAEVMKKDVKTVRSTDTVREASRIMKESNIGSLIVISGSGEATGIITERDIVVDIVSEGKDADKTRIEEIMSKKMVTTEPDKTLEEVADIMTEHNIRRLPVVFEGRLVGIVTATDLITYEKKLIEKLSKVFAISPPAKIGG